MVDQLVFLLTLLALLRTAAQLTTLDHLGTQRAGAVLVDRILFRAFLAGLARLAEETPGKGGRTFMALFLCEEILIDASITLPVVGAVLASFHKLPAAQTELLNQHIILHALLAHSPRLAPQTVFHQLRTV